MEILDDFDKDFDSDYDNHKHRRSGRSIVGIIFVLAGLFFAVRYIDIIPNFVERILFSWQALFIIIGIIFIVKKENSRTGIILIIIGGISLISRFNFFWFDLSGLWFPAILIAVGFIIFGKSRNKKKAYRKKAYHPGLDDSDIIDRTCILGGGSIFHTSQNFQGGKLVAILGGFKLDLTEAQLAEGVNVLDITSILGGVELVIPSEWRVKVTGTAILGAYEDKRKTYSRVEIETDPGRELVITGAVLMGGVEIKRV